MMNQAPQQFSDVTVEVKANIYFDGKVVSHTVLLKDGIRKTLGLIYPGSFSFNTGTSERMEITAGICRVKIAAETEFKSYAAGTYFDVPAHSKFEIAVEKGIVEYVCSFR